MQPTLRAALEKHPNDLRIVFHHFTVHESARPLAIAALAAGEQGKFWPMHDAIYEDITHMRTREQVLAAARKLGLDMARFESDLASPRLLAAVEADDELAATLGLTGTPIFFLDGRPMIGGMLEDTLEKAIAEETAHADALLAKGVKPAALYDTMIKDGDREAPPAPPSNPSLDPATHYTVPTGNAPSRGAAKAKITLVVYGDFECPYCKKLEATLTELRKLYGDDMRVVFKHFPSTKAHPHARLAARAAIAAGAQGKFWEMHDLLYAHQDALEHADVERYAAELGLDVERFKHDLEAHVGDPLVRADTEEAVKLGIRGIPTSFVNGRPIVGAQPSAAFRKVIDEELLRAP
jgi:protein-disulfide isomerase